MCRDVPLDAFALGIAGQVFEVQATQTVVEPERGAGSFGLLSCSRRPSVRISAGAKLISHL